MNERVRAKQWPKEANAIRLMAIERGERAIKFLENGRKEARHGNHLLAMADNADAQSLIKDIISELRRAGSLSRLSEGDE